jgi:pantothenate kinase
LDDPGVDCTVLVDFRARLLAQRLEERILQALLERLRAAGRQRTDSAHVLAAVRTGNRMELVNQSAWRWRPWPLPRRTGWPG